VLAWIGVSGAPASAHAVLVRTDPPSGAVVPTAPAAIRITFSEGVETRFSAIQLLDQAGDELPAGDLRRSRGGRDLVMPVPSLPAGSYTVAWEVLASDGHPTEGQFAFQVGPASATPPPARAVARRTGSDPEVGLLFGQVRFVWFAAFMVLVGSVAVRRLVWDPAVEREEAGGSPADTAFRRSFARSLSVSWLVLAGAGASTLLLESATVSGAGLKASLRPAVLGSVLATAFGRLWLAQMGLTLLLGLPVLALRRRGSSGSTSRRWSGAVALVAAGLDIVVVLNGQKTVDVQDSKHASGPLALQYGSGVIKFRKVQIKPL